MIPFDVSGAFCPVAESSELRRLAVRGAAAAVSAQGLGLALEVVGTIIDVDEKKVEMVHHSRSPIIKPGLTDIIRRGVKAGKLRATTDKAKLGAVSLICVATPALN
jgi:UDP-glucose 6-dehydrogenase